MGIGGIVALARHGVHGDPSSAVIGLSLALS
jgi:hypothetical protein